MIVGANDYTVDVHVTGAICKKCSNTYQIKPEYLGLLLELKWYWRD